VHVCVCVCVRDQEEGRWRSVSLEGAPRVGLRSEEGEGAVRTERMVEMGVSFSLCVCVCGGGVRGAHET